MGCLNPFADLLEGETVSGAPTGKIVPKGGGHFALRDVVLASATSITTDLTDPSISFDDPKFIPMFSFGGPNRNPLFHADARQPVFLKIGMTESDAALTGIFPI